MYSAKLKNKNIFWVSNKNTQKSYELGSTFKIKIPIKYLIQGWTIFFYAPDFSRLIGHVNYGCAQLMCAFNRETTKYIPFCNLLRKWGLQLSFLMCFIQRSLQWSVYILNAIWMSKKKKKNAKCASKDKAYL